MYEFNRVVENYMDIVQLLKEKRAILGAHTLHAFTINFKLIRPIWK